MDQTTKCILVDNISLEWKKFAHEASFDNAVINYIDLDNCSDQLKMNKLLQKLVLRRPSDFMSVVEKCLKQMGKVDIWNEMQIIHKSNQLKAYYLNPYATIHRQVQTQRSDLISKLKLASVEKEDLEIVNDDFNEWEFFCHKQNGYEPIKNEKLFDESSHLILVSGLKGIGKTNFLQSCLYHWAKGLHWENFNFVFYFEFSKINKLQNVSNIKQLINKFYKNILNGYEVSSLDGTVFIMDGLDEFLYLEQLINHEYSNNVPILSVLGNILSLKNCKCVLSGNITAILRYCRTVEDNKNVANMLHLGFNTSGTKSFLEDFLYSKTLITDLEELSTSSCNGAALLSVPLYLKAACSTLLTLSIQSVKTMTELQTLIFLYFLQQNCESNVPLWRLVQINQQHVLKVCEVAFYLLDKGKVNVSQDELGSVLDENGNEPLGFIKKSVLTQRYHFIHLLLMTLCASVHLLFNVNVNEIITNERLRNCLPFVSGFVHCNERSFLSLFCQLKKPLHNQTDWLRDICEHNDPELFIECFFEAQISMTEDLKSAIDNRRQWIIKKEDEINADQVAKQEHFRAKYSEAEIVNDCIQNQMMALFFITNNFNCAKNDREQLVDADQILGDAKNLQTTTTEEKLDGTLNTKKWIATFSNKNELFDLAEKTYRDIEPIVKVVLGEKGATKLNLKSRIEEWFYKNNQYDKTEEMFRDVENMRREVLEEKHTDTLSSKYRVARRIYDNKYFNKAEKMFRDLEKLQKEVLGEKHVDTLSSKHWVAKCLYNKKQFDKAEKMFRNVEKLQKEVLGEEHAYTLCSKHWVAKCINVKKSYLMQKRSCRVVENMR